MAELVLQFISGKYRGGEFPLEPGKEVVIGRGSDLDMVLVEDMVSRKHAKITHENGGFYIQDLGSTNGTFVNGERIKKKQIQDGDRLLIGTSILKLSGKGAEAPVKEKEPEEKEEVKKEIPPPPPPDIEEDISASDSIEIEEEISASDGIEIEEEIEEDVEVPISEEKPSKDVNHDTVNEAISGDEVTPPPIPMNAASDDDGIPDFIEEDDEIEVEPSHISDTGKKEKPQKVEEESLSLPEDDLDQVLEPSDKEDKVKPKEKSKKIKEPKIAEKKEEIKKPKPQPDEGRFKNRGKPTMTGEVEEVHIPDLMQLFTVSKKTGTCYIDRPGETAKIYFKDGHIYYAELSTSPGLDPYKAALRILIWEKGDFSMCVEKPITPEKEIAANTNSLLMDSVTQKDELERLYDKIGGFSKNIALILPPKTPFRELKPKALDSLEYVLQAVTVHDVMDKHRGSDKEAIEGLTLLLDAEIIELE